VKPRRLTTTLVLAALLVWPLLPFVPYDALNTANLAAHYLIVALSLVVLVGLVGQISLCQASLVGVGAFTSALAVKHLGLQFPFVLVVGVAAGAVTASLIGIVALRVRGLYLAVATLIFAYVCDAYLFTQPFFVESQSGTSIPPEAVGHAGVIPYFDLADAHVFYFVALAVAMAVLYSVANLRESRLGRAFAAIRGSEVAAASLGIDVTRFKLIGFAVAGAMAGLAGSLFLIGQRTVAPDQFNFIASLYFLSIAVVGGLRSLGGAIGSALLFALLVGEVFFRFPRLADFLDVISAALLVAVLLFFRGGLGAVPERLREVWRRTGWAGRVRVPELSTRWLRAIRVGRRAAEPEDGAVATPQVGSDAAGRPRGEVVELDLHRARHEWELEPELAQSRGGFLARFHGHDQDMRPPVDVHRLLRMGSEHEDVAGQPRDDGRRHPVLLRADHVTVQFGGLVAVSDASIEVGAGEIVGLIGPNGAGKTTLFNSLLGLNTPSAGTVQLYGRDVTRWAVHRRAALGVGRTFQILQLFPELTVFENLLVATHLQSRTGVLGAILVTEGARRHERAARRRVDAVLRLMNLEQYAERRVEGLPFGVLRLIEVARTLVTGAPLVCFDEPASGLDSTETEKLIEWFRYLRRVGITLLVIEHDVDMVTRLCDFIYVVEQGRVIAAGTAAQVSRDPAVIASYLGTPVEAAS
jgi:ABC-type branched-subunit amino acid transport system ATPase component/ABC-type branched-subunit amino acid transport system permease subunit